MRRVRCVECGRLRSADRVNVIDAQPGDRPVCGDCADAWELVGAMESRCERLTIADTIRALRKDENRPAAADLLALLRRGRVMVSEC